MILATYHLKANFPGVDPEIKNNLNVQFFYFSPDKNATHPGISSKFYNQKIVKTYGPFFNIGGGDVPRGPVYILFYSATKK